MEGCGTGSAAARAWRATTARRASWTWIAAACRAACQTMSGRRTRPGAQQQEIQQTCPVLDMFGKDL